MAKQDPSKYEYTLADAGVTAVAKNGQRFDFSERVGGSTYNPNGSSTVGKGSATSPRYHTRTVYEPTFSITIPIDERDRFEKWLKVNAAADGGICDIERRRKKPKVSAVVDKFEDWLPIPGEEALAEGEATMVEVSGNLLTPRKDITNALTV